MPKAKRDLATEVDALIDRGFYIQREAVELAKQLAKIPFAERALAEPIRKANNLFSIAGRIDDLARALLQKPMLEEQRGQIAKTMQARMDAET